jgi:hypothetical protein
MEKIAPAEFSIREFGSVSRSGSQYSATESVSQCDQIVILIRFVTEIAMELL